MKKGIYTFLLVSISFAASGQEKMLAKIDSLISDAEYETALTQINNSLADATFNERLVRQNKKVEILILLGRLDEAESQLSEIPRTDNSFFEGLINTNKGFLYLQKARNDLALENLKMALLNFQKAGKSTSQEAALCLSHLSFTYLSIGKLNQALENGLLALQLRQKLFGDESEQVAASYNDLGVVYSQFNSDKALDYYEKALAVYEKSHGEDHPKIAIANTNIGMMYQQSKLYGDAINNFERAEKIWEKVYPNGHPNQGVTLFNLGKTYNLMGDSKTAIAFFNKAIGQYKKTLDEKHPSISTVYNQLGTVYLNENNYEKALACAQAALRSNIPSFDNSDVNVNPQVKEFYNGIVFLYSLQLKAEALEARHFGKSLKFSDLTLALNSIFKADSLVDIIRHASDDENDKIALGALSNDIFENGVNLAYEMSQMSLEANKYKEIAFYFAEKSKSAVLQESIADAEAKAFAGIPAELLTTERELKSSLSFVNQKLAQKPTSEEEGILRQKLFLLNQQYQAFTNKLEKDFPEYFLLKYESKNPTKKDIQSKLERRSALVSYFISEKRKKLFRFVITPTALKIKVTAIDDNFNRFVSGFSNSLLFNDNNIFQTTAPPLSKVLTTGLPKRTDNLVIVPTGKLSSIPFEALLLKKTSNLDFDAKPFLINKYSVSYEFSANLFLQKSKAVISNTTPSIFLCAPIKFSESQGLDELAGSEAEVNSIASLFSKEQISMATHEQATEGKVKEKQIKNFTYLHFATHGIVDEESPELSRIFLSLSENEDGNLFSGEIFNLSLPSELAVLSACQTGLGKLSKGEGVIGLSRALTYAGVKNIVVSFWRVNDESTSQLMTDFYKNLITPPSPHFNTALRQAKLTMIKNKRYSSPYYWAPFVLIGQ